MPPRKPPPPPAEGTVDLFGGQPVGEVRVEAAPESWGALDVTWHKPKAGRQLCDDCTAAIHRREAGAGTSPLVATTRRKGPVSELHLCPGHAQMRRDLDDRAKREAAARRAAVEQGGGYWAKPTKRKQREHA